MAIKFIIQPILSELQNHEFSWLGLLVKDWKNTGGVKRYSVLTSILTTNDEKVDTFVYLSLLSGGHEFMSIPGPAVLLSLIMWF